MLTFLDRIAVFGHFKTIPILILSVDLTDEFNAGKLVFGTIQ
jgi:hypothetical protein